MTPPRIVRIGTADEAGRAPAALSAGSVVTIGAFDGVHQGHRKVLRLVRDLADARGLDAALLTFDRHPAQVVRPDSAPRLLTTLEQKLELLERTGLLDLGFEVVGLGLVAPEGDEDHEPYSSTRVRGALANGDVDAAASLLGRYHEVRGTVVEGDRRGRELGFPTANVMVPAEVALPADGIYAGRFRAEDRVWRDCAISLGRRPTFYEHAESSLLEAYVLDFDGDLYGQAVAVRFVARLRGEARFASAEELAAQIARDVEDARVTLGAVDG
jgi:riboflavin kinase/FMN adenylyltransferase